MNSTRTPLQYRIREATPDDGDAILALMPRLASFDLPPTRNPKHLWVHDVELLKTWMSGNTENCFIHIAVSSANSILGLAIMTLRPELLSHEPSAHLEALAVGEGAEGMGIGGALIAATEEEARARGALSITLHVFTRNHRARKVYKRAGYDEELIRCTKQIQ